MNLVLENRPNLNPWRRAFCGKGTGQRRAQSSVGMSLVGPCDKGEGVVDAKQKNKMGLWERNTLSYVR